MFIQSIRQTHSRTKEIRAYSQIEQKVEMQDKLVPLRAHDQSHPQSTFPLLLAVLEDWAADGRELSVCLSCCLSLQEGCSFLLRQMLLAQAASTSVEMLLYDLSPSQEKYLSMLMLSCNAHRCSAVASSTPRAPQNHWIRMSLWIQVGGEASSRPEQEISQIFGVS